MTTTPMVQCGFRMAFAAVVASQSLSTLVAPMLPASPSTGLAGMGTPLDTPLVIALHVLLLVVAIWVACGIHTRPVACIGLMLLAGYTLTSQGFQDDTSAHALVLASVFALPLFAAGGGAFSMYRKGWSGLAGL